MDIRRLAQTGDNGVLLLIGDSAGIETEGYTPSEKAVIPVLSKTVQQAPGRVIVVMPVLTLIACKYCSISLNSQAEKLRCWAKP